MTTPPQSPFVPQVSFRNDEDLLATTLQLQERRAQLELWRLQKQMWPGPWGVEKLSLNPGALAAGRLVFEHLRVTLPDGARVLVPEDTRLEPLTLDPAQVSGGLVDLVVPRLMPGEPNVDTAPGDPLRRFRRERLRTVDLELGANGIDEDVPVLRVNAWVQFGGTADERMLRVPLFTLTEGSDGRPAVDEGRSWPPATRVAACPGLRGCLRIIESAMVTADRRLEAAIARAQGTVAEHELLLRHVDLRTRQAELAELLAGHPWEAFEWLRGLEAAWSALLRTPLPPERRYDHLDLSGCFTPLFAEGARSLAAADELGMPFVSAEDGMLECHVDARLLRRARTAWLELPDDGQDVEVGRVRLCSRSEVADHRRRRDGGIALRKDTAGRGCFALLRNSLPAEDGPLCLILEARNGAPAWDEARLVVRLGGLAS